MNTYWKMLSSALLASVALNFAHAADEVFETRYEGKPAVSGFNGKIEFGYTYIDFDSFPPDMNVYRGSASLSAPIGDKFGVQLDAGLSNITLSGAGSSGTIYGFGLHGFWRDPDVALAGLYADVTFIPDIDATVYRAGVEAEVYLNRVSIEGFVGAQWADTLDTTFTGDLTAAFYPMDDLRLAATVIRSFDENFGKISAEYQANFNGFQPTFTADVMFGDNVVSYGAGLKFYFGQDGSKSLIRRHREDDPRDRTADMFFTAGVSAAGASLIEEDAELGPPFQCFIKPYNETTEDNLFIPIRPIDSHFPKCRAP